MSLGSKIRSKRKELDLSLRELAARTGLTPSFISLVERDLADPSITSLRRMADALETPLFHLFNEVTDGPVVRHDQRRKLKLHGSHLEYEVLSPPSASHVLFYSAVLQPGACSTEELLSHPLEECALVVQGRLKIELGSDTYILEKGDSIGWDGTVPHRLTSIGSEPLILISCASPPLF